MELLGIDRRDMALYTIGIIFIACAIAANIILKGYTQGKFISIGLAFVGLSFFMICLNLSRVRRMR